MNSFRRVNRPMQIALYCETFKKFERHVLLISSTAAIILWHVIRVSMTMFFIAYVIYMCCDYDGQSRPLAGMSNCLTRGSTEVLGSLTFFAELPIR
jgi:hypothetical protein